MKERDFNEILKRKGYGISSSLSTKKSNDAKNSDPRSVRNMESGSSDESLAKGLLTLNYSGRPIVRFKVFRKRLTDYPRSDCEKYIIDSLRYAGLIRDDSEAQIRFEDLGHEKVKNVDDERIEIEIIYEHINIDKLWTPIA